MMVKVLKLIIIELLELFKIFIIGYPNSFIGSHIRRVYWSKQFNISNIKYIGKGARIISRNTLNIGNHFILGDNSTLINTDGYGCYIGEKVSIAQGCYIRTANHCIEDFEKPIIDQGHTAKSMNYLGDQYSVIIEDNVWLGANSIILSGANIGKGSVISAGSVVSSIIPSYSIVVGNPGRVTANREKLSEFKKSQIESGVSND